MFSPDTLKGKSILVTGGGSGLGFAMAKQFAGLGANVAICGRSKEKLLDAVAQIPQPSAKMVAKDLDVRDYHAVGNMIDELWEDFGSLDGLVNNAAGNFLCCSEDLSPNAFKSVVDIVLTGTFNCSNHFGSRLIDNKKPGAILNIVTTYTETGSAFVLPSACAKAGVYAMTNSLAYEWASYGIRVNAIAPGPFPTSGAWQRLIPGEKYEQAIKEHHPMGRLGDPSELADLAAFLMSDLASYISGTCVNIDGAQRFQGGQFNALAELMPRDELKKLFQAMKPKK